MVWARAVTASDLVKGWVVNCDEHMVSSGMGVTADSAGGAGSAADGWVAELLAVGTLDCLWADVGDMGDAGTAIELEHFVVYVLCSRVVVVVVDIDEECCGSGALGAWTPTDGVWSGVLKLVGVSPCID